MERRNELYEEVVKVARKRAPQEEATERQGWREWKQQRQQQKQQWWQQWQKRRFISQKSEETLLKLVEKIFKGLRKNRGRGD